jgi:arsenite transporter
MDSPKDLDKVLSPYNESKATPSNDLERGQNDQSSTKSTIPQQSAFKSLGWLDRLLALWILLAMIIGVLLGNFVPSVGPALQRGKFVGVSIPIGKSMVAC